MSQKWIPLTQALERVAARQNVSTGAAWEIIKKDIRDRNLAATCVNEKGVRVNLEPAWMGFVVSIPVTPVPRPLPPGERPTLPIAKPETFPVADFRENDRVWFDRIEAFNCGVEVLPPHLGVDILIDAADLGEPENSKVRRSRDTKRAVAAAVVEIFHSGTVAAGHGQLTAIVKVIHKRPEFRGHDVGTITRYARPAFKTEQGKSKAAAHSPNVANPGSIRE